MTTTPNLENDDLSTAENTGSATEQSSTESEGRGTNRVESRALKPLSSQIELERELIKLEHREAATREIYEQEIKQFEETKKNLNKKLKLVMQGVDMEKLRVAETVMYVSGRYSEAGFEANQLIKDLIKDLAMERGERMKTHYFGLKSYAQWHGQRSDHTYSKGPTHGHIIFEVGLKPEARERNLSDEELEACLYFARNIESIQKIITE